MSILFAETIKTLPNVIHPYLIDIKKIIEKRIGFSNVSSILLFGSYARGEFTKNSDVDVLIIIKDEFYKQQSRLFFRKLEQLFLATEQKHKLLMERKNPVSGLLMSVEKSTGMFVSHFVCKESDWKSQQFHKIFHVNRLMAMLLAPGDIVLKNMRSSYIPIYNDMPNANFKNEITIGQVVKSLFMNLLLAIGGVVVFPFWRDSIKYSMESLKWSLRNSYLYLSDEPASLVNIIDFYEKISGRKTFFSKFVGLRKYFSRDLGFAMQNIYYGVKIHLVAINQKRTRLLHKNRKL